MTESAVPLHIALVEPEIPQNTGNIARTCVALGARLHLIGHLGFSLDDRYLKRAGLDYWFDLDLKLWDDVDTFLRTVDAPAIYYTTTKARRSYSSVPYPAGTCVLFGKETRGLPESLLAVHPERCIRLPMRPGTRSLNLANTVAVVAYEAVRRQDFPGLV